MSQKILAFAGSTRRDSYNKKLVLVAAEGARRTGAEVTVLDLADYPMPLFDEDLETKSGIPENGRLLKEIFAAHAGLLISSPEYNSSISAVLKNTIDWLSRRETPDEAPLASLAGKVACLMSASPGSLGGLRGLVHLRAILGNLQILVLPQQRAVASAHKAFSADGRLKDPKLQKAIEGLGSGLAEVVTKLG